MTPTGVAGRRCCKQPPFPHAIQGSTHTDELRPLRMATLVRRIFKTLLLCGLFFLSGRYVHTYPIPMTPDQQQQLIVISEKFGVDDYELL